MTTTKKQGITHKITESWFAKSEERINKVIARKFGASFMSDAKWRKLFNLLAASQYPIVCYRWKFVDEDEKLFTTGVLKSGELDEKHTKDGRYVPYVYKDIEWLEVVTEHAQQITDQLLEKGQFAIDKTASGFKIIGYA